jgi:hypothetical protein
MRDLAYHLDRLQWEQWISKYLFHDAESNINGKLWISQAWLVRCSSAVSFTVAKRSTAGFIQESSAKERHTILTVCDISQRLGKTYRGVVN